ncbi:hypothetical protein L596_025383 [Steinernema carpocapsae]|uniref:Uncharacterized protein n=1 Tax=Steinernema carpocapsae TaxID=34508 RepID=A0A4U5M7M0_STECR|nr:hypothetical protein L596_025383 [Steinernema carpocapsae]
MHRALLASLVFLGVVSTGFAVICDTCDTLCGCLRVVPEECPDYMLCYTKYDEKDEFVIRKGCTRGCDNVNIQGGKCEDCKGDRCNSPLFAPYASGYGKCRDSYVGYATIGKGSGVIKTDDRHQAIGTGAEPNGPPGGIGGGAVPNDRGSASTVVSSLFALLSALYFLA